MKPQTQSRVGKRGRCFNACLASLLEIPELQVPDFDDDNYEASVDNFLKKYGVYYRHVSTAIKPIGFHVIEGKSPRGGLHAVVGKDGSIVHDPHPHDGTGRGLVRVDKYGVLIRRMD